MGWGWGVAGVFEEEQEARGWGTMPQGRHVKAEVVRRSEDDRRAHGTQVWAAVGLGPSPGEMGSGCKAFRKD